MLTGSDLLHKLKELGDISKSDLVRSCGYVSTKKNGEERLNFTSFYEALLEAKGVSLGANGFAGDSKPGRKLSYYRHGSRQWQFINWQSLFGPTRPPSWGRIRDQAWTPTNSFGSRWRE
jgi:hypothetical protein